MATFVVDFGGDAVDAGDGVTSFREAINAANGAPGLDEIIFAQNVSTVTLATGVDINDDLIISGDRTGDGIADVTFIGFSQLNTFSTMFANQATTVIRDVNITNFVSDNVGFPAFPNSIGVDSSGVIINNANLTLERVQFDGLFIRGGPGAPGLMPLKAPDGAEGNPGGNGDPGGSGTPGFQGGYAYVIGNFGASLTLTDVGFGSGITVIPGKGGTGGTGGEGGDGGDGEDNIDLTLGGHAGNGGPGGQGGIGGPSGIGAYIGLFGNSNLTVTTAVGRAGQIISIEGGDGGAGGIGGAGGDGGFGIIDDGDDGAPGAGGVPGPMGDFATVGFAFEATNEFTPDGVLNPNFNAQLATTVVFVHPVTPNGVEGDLLGFNFNRVGLIDNTIILDYEIFPGVPGEFTVDDIGNAVLTGIEVIPTGQRGLFKNFAITDDILSEGDENFFLALTNLSINNPLLGETVAAGTSAVEGVIAESDPEINLVGIDLVSMEGQTISFEVVRTGSQGGYDVEVEFLPFGDPGFTGDDLGGGLQPLTEIIPIGPGGTGRQDLSVFLTEDMLPEGMENFEIRINSVLPAPGGDPATIGNGSLIGTIIDSGAATLVDLVPINVIVDEGGFISFDITRSGDTFSSFTVDWAVMPKVGSGFDINDLAPGASLTGQVQFGIDDGMGGIPNVFEIDIPTNDDALPEGIEEFTIEITDITADIIIVEVGDGPVIGGNISLDGQINASDQVVQNTPPVAVDDSFLEDQNSGGSVFDVLANDTDADGDPLSVSTITQPSNGVAANQGNTVSYVPNFGFFGVDSFTYTVSDGNGGTDLGLVTVTVREAQAGNTPPMAMDDAFTIPANFVAYLDVRANDTDAEQTALTISGTSGGAIGVPTTDGSFVLYQPLAFTTGQDTFTYTVIDGQGGVDQATVTVTVIDNEEGNTPPSAETDIFDIDRFTPLTFDPRDNDFDVDGDPLTVSALTDQPEGGRAFFNGDGTLSYAPRPGFVGFDSFRYAVTDGKGGVDEGEVDIFVAETSERIVCAHTIAYMYEAAFNRFPDEPGVNFWIDAFNFELPGQTETFTKEDIAEFFLTVPEFVDLYGPVDQLTDAELIEQLFLNTLDRPGDSAGVGFWEGVLANPDFSRADMLIAFATSPENQLGSPDIITLAETSPSEWEFFA